MTDVATSAARLTQRPYENGDAARLIELWNRSHAAFGGHVKRTEPYWRWCVLERPKLEPADIIVFESARTPCAYGVLDPRGHVLELAIDPDIVGDQRQGVAERLIAALEARCRDRGYEMMVMELPRSDSPLNRALLASGYRAEPAESLSLMVLDMALLLERILVHRAGRLPHGWAPAFDVLLTAGHYRYHPEDALHIQLAPEVRVSPGATGAPCTIATDRSTLSDIVFRRDDFDSALAAGRLTVEPTTAEQDARTLVSFLSIKAPWYTPAADAR